ncbi:MULTISPECIES: acetolactate decarboxylase [Leuconostoc]|uniref:Alpha-acetolactate decarboxylase n=2 Tax=Leuconostoc kimchii TaxID=136609 RepID=D5T1E0_LEUKI|nr:MULTISPECIES: acetolactate decarboxylase [Leuconostoc]ADG40089.1 alpha-acetolactate decarboxylase [Leuconostoc kimchii IMSNU 11154]QBR47202.1 acetolactate decarboxylase [Leuconostoc kimchii]
MSSLYQHGTLAMLMGKQMQGTASVAELLAHGDTGIGTFEGLDGEGIILDGKVYQALSNGQVVQVTDQDVLLPFVSVHFHEPTEVLPFSEVDFGTLSSKLEKFQLDNIFAAIKFHGKFSHVHTRVVAKQTIPFPSLLDVSKNQPEFHRDDVAGTLVGYYAPEIFNGPTAAGWHVHFLSDDKKFAGHVLDFSATEVDGTLQLFDDFIQHLPIDNAEFRDMSLDLDGLSSGIKASEGRKA